MINIFLQKIFLKVARSDYRALIIIMPIFAILYFYYKVDAPFPSIPAGLYALMGETIAANNFSLPATIPYYGPGGIPFGYPPLAFYMMAFSQVYLHVNSFDYLRFAPSLFLLISLVPMYLLAKEITKSQRKAAIATCLFGTSFGIVANHYYSPGLCRGIALFFMLFCIYFAYRTFFSPKFLFTLATSIFLGLSVLSHLFYAEFGIIFIFAMVIFPTELPFWRKFVIGSVIGIGSLVITLPWWLTIISLHGFQIFMSALRTHDVTSILHIFNGFPGGLIFLLNNLITYRYENPILIGTAILGISFCVAKRDFMLPGWLILSILVLGGDGQRFIAIICSILGAIAINILLLHLPEISWKKIRPRQSTIIVFGGYSFLIMIAALLAFFFRLGTSVKNYAEVIVVFIGVCVITNIIAYSLTNTFIRRKEAPVLNLKELGIIFLTVTSSAIVISTTMIALHALKLFAQKVPHSVLALNWLLMIIFTIGFQLLLIGLNSDDPQVLPILIFILILVLGSYIAQPTLFNIDSVKTKNFFNNVSDMSKWLEKHVPPEASYLMVSEDESYQLPGILRFDDEWFPYMLKRTPVVCPYGAEWTGGYDRQQALLAEVHECSRLQSWICLKTFMTSNHINPDLLIIHKHDDSYSIYSAISMDENWQMIYENQEYAIWELFRSK